MVVELAGKSNSAPLLDNNGGVVAEQSVAEEPVSRARFFSFFVSSRGLRTIA